MSINLRPVVRRAVASGLAVLGASLAMGAGDAAASGSGGISVKEARKAADLSHAGVVALQRALGITADGVYGPQTKRAVKRFQRKHGLAVDGIAGPQTLKALGLDATALQAGGGKALPRGLAAVLEKIAACESGGDPTAKSPDGRYRGKYQFSRATWRGLGGEGDPAKAPERLQDRLAAKLYRQSGATPWPNCA